MISFCPDLDHQLLLKYVQCLGYAKICNNLDPLSLMVMLPTIHAAIQICETYNLPWIESYFLHELRRADYKNMSFADHLEHFLNPKWTEENSFCMDDGQNFGSTEVYTKFSGLCFVLNSNEKIYNQRCLHITACLVMRLFSFFCSDFQHISGNYTAKCRHSSRIKNGMTIELSARKARQPKEWLVGGVEGGDSIYPLVCYAELGVVHIHSKELFLPTVSAYGQHNTAYSLVVTPKITTADESLRDFHPNEYALW